MTARVVVAGAGIGGLTAALALARTGREVLVLERAAALNEVGAGLQLSPNACHCLAGLDVLETVRARAFEPEAIRIRSADNAGDLTRLPLGATVERRYGAPYLVVHRADLQQALFDAANAEPSIEISFGQSIASVEQRGDGLPQVITNDTSGQRRSHEASLLVGADGVWSSVRNSIAGHETARFSGRTAYRATVPSDMVSPDLLNETGLWLGSHAHLVHYPVRQGREFNIVAIVAENWTEQTWSAPADREALLQRFSGWAPEARELLATPDSWLKWALCGVPASGPWVSERTALLGDAAHGMLPFAAQGAAMAIEDAVVLASLLKSNETDIASALLTYERVRRPRVAKVQSLAQQNGKIYHLGGPLAFARNTVMRMTAPDRLAARMDWIYSWRPDR